MLRRQMAVSHRHLNCTVTHQLSDSSNINTRHLSTEMQSYGDDRIVYRIDLIEEYGKFIASKRFWSPRRGLKWPNILVFIRTGRILTWASILYVPTA
jgi:hypothetical protein